MPYRGCPVLLPEIDEGLQKITAALRAAGFSGARENGGRPAGLVRHIVMRQARFTGEKLIAVIATRRPSDKERALLSRAAAGIKGLAGIVWNVNANPGNFIWGGETVTICGKPVITEKLGEYSFTFEASSFFQVNSEQALALYRRAAALASEGGAREVLELYSGVGSLTAFLAARARRVAAVESWLPAAKYIKQNLARNGMDNVEPRTAQAEDIAEELASRRFDTVVLDPPRTGCDEKVVNAILKIAPRARRLRLLQPRHPRPRRETPIRRRLQTRGSDAVRYVPADGARGDRGADAQERVKRFRVPVVVKSATTGSCI